MRINIYAEELTTRQEIVVKEVEGTRFYGVRQYLKTHEDMIPPKHRDDDSSAVTFWFHHYNDAQSWVSQIHNTIVLATPQESAS
jgi:hypothetical protein